MNTTTTGSLRSIVCRMVIAAVFALIAGCGGGHGGGPGAGHGPLSNKIVVASTGGLFAMNPDGSNVTHLPNTIDGDSNQDVTRDGTKVLFVRNITGGGYTMNADGSNLVHVTTGGG